MRHGKTPVMLLRERFEKANAKIALLEAAIDVEKRFSSSLLDKNEARIRAELTRMQKERNAAKSV